MADTRIDELPEIAAPGLNYVVPAMGEGAAGKLTIPQILAGFHLSAEGLALDDGDEFGYGDSNASWLPKRISWANLKAGIASASMTLASKTLTAPKINDASATHQYILVPSELAANRNVTLPLLTANDEFVFKDFAQTLNNKTIGDALQGTLLAGSIFGLILSNNVADATNDIDVAPGWAASDNAVPALMVLAAARTKRLDAAWAVGNNQGGLDTGAIANTTYHVWLIRRPDTGVVDVLFSASATAPTMPANYTQKRYLGPIVRASAAIRGFRQSGNLFMWNTKIADRNSTAAFAAALLTLSVPTGINVKPIVEDIASVNVSSTATISIGGAASGSVEMQIASLASGSGAGLPGVANPPPVFETNTSGQLYYQVVVSSGSFSVNTLNTLGFIFERGR